MNWTGRALTLLAVLILGAGLAACGSDDSDSGSGSGSGSEAASGIEGTTWSLMNVAAQGSASSIPNSVEAPTVEFADGQVQLFAGCNSGSGPAEVGEDTIEFGPIALTRKGCPGDAGQVESVVTKVLRGEAGYELEQGSLVIEGKQYSLIFTPAES